MANEIIEGVTITLTKKKAEEIFYDALCNGAGYIRGHGIEIDYESEDYKKAKERLNKKGVGACFEDVLLEIIKGKKTLKLKDLEDENSEYNRSITLSDIHKRVANTPFQHLSDWLTGNDDAVTADVILQTVFLESVIFG